MRLEDIPVPDVCVMDGDYMAGMASGLRSSYSKPSYVAVVGNLSTSKPTCRLTKSDSLQSLPVRVPERVPTPMDFSQFRESGELSDITVSVDGRDFQLHKFPLYTRSDFFRALARSDSAKVVLDEFPGGAETFEMVANYCYNKRIDVSRDNICRVRCAAEFLQMGSPGNLSDCADRYLLDLLTTAKLSRDIKTIVELMLSCRPLGAIAEQAKIIERCVDSIVDCWLLSSKWSSRRAPSGKYMSESSDSDRLNRLPLAWFQQLLTSAKDKKMRGSLLGRLVQTYISDRIEQAQDDGTEEEKQGNKDNKDGGDSKGDSVGTPDDQGTDSKDSTTAAGNDPKDDSKTDSDQNQGKATVEENEDAEVEDDGEEDEEEDEEEDFPVEDVDLAVVLDTLLLDLPECLPLAECVEPSWAVRVLRVADELQCKCRGLLVALAGQLLYRFKSTELAELPADLLSEVVAEATKDPKRVDQELVCAVLDSYLFELAERDQLDLEVFKKMALAAPKDHRQNHDVLFKVLEKLLNSDSSKIQEKEKEVLLDAIDFTRLSEETLERAHTSQLVPDSFVAKAALALCGRLRGELERAREVIRAQEEELDKLGLGSTSAARRGFSGGLGAPSSSWLHHGASETDYGVSTSPPDDDDSEPYEPDNTPLRLHPAYSSVAADDFIDGTTLGSRRFSPPGVDPILEKALGGRYFDDPFHVDSLYPYYYQRGMAGDSSLLYNDYSDLSFERELNRRRKNIRTKYPGSRYNTTAKSSRMSQPPAKW